ncbi:hypothetical protein [uncultured Jatrophihabitans sp.]|uniref:hypothetical protein n=1 Tax=uncultured Jatrophihabitans sp. TaxID=1610747 RepID=UPI0035CC40AE
MSDERTGAGGGGRRPYNRPRRYTLATPVTSAVDPVAPGPAPDPAHEPYAYSGTWEHSPAYPPAPVSAGPSRTQSTRGLLIGVAVLVVIAAVGLVVGLVAGLSGNDDATLVGASSAGPPPAASTSAASTGASASEVCTRLGSTSPFRFFVAEPHPAERMPASYVEPQAGSKVGVCVGRFRAGAGAGRGRFAYLAQYERLPATKYALRLKTLGWVLVPTLPNPTYRNQLTTTVTLVQQGTALVTVVGTGN